MGTSNFRAMREFDIYCVVDEYDKKWYAEMYPDLDEERRFEIFCVVSNEHYNEVWNAIDEEISKTRWMFHSAEMQNGYYDGIQILIHEPDGKWFDVDLEGMYEERTERRCKMNRRELRREYWKEVNLIRGWLEEMREKHCLRVLRVSARFSNGETWYSEVTDRKEDCEVVS